MGLRVRACLLACVRVCMYVCVLVRVRVQERLNRRGREASQAGGQLTEARTPRPLTDRSTCMVWVSARSLC
jgi:hypothetical protein